MQKFIKLNQKTYITEDSKYVYDAIYVNVGNIACFGDFGIMFVGEGNTKPLSVKESPEEILELIQGE